MLKAEFRCFLIKFVPVLNFRIGVGHIAVMIKKQRDWLLVLIFFWSIKILFFKKRTTASQALDSIPETNHLSQSISGSKVML